MEITQKFLRAKHWQVFMLTVGIIMIFQIVMTITTIASIGNSEEPDPLVMSGMFKIMPVLMIIFTLTFFGWFWSIAIGLQYKVPEGARMKTGKFKIFFFFPIIYILLLMIGFGLAMSGLFEMIAHQEQPDFNIENIIGIIIPLHVFSMFCIFYSLYFASKTFKTVELQRAATFSDFAGEFFLFWFFPIGIWIIQPKINKMVEND